MTYAVPVVDLEDVQLEAVRAGMHELGAIQVVNHGVAAGLSEDLGRRMARLLSLPRAEKGRLAKDRVADYLAAYGRPEQIAAWRDGMPYVAELAENSAGR
jgi:isopenicillin N synthase-like dioxygenase